MATGDRPRNIFDPEKYYHGVGMQQGRVLTDDDYNEGERIRLEDQRRAWLDLIGPHGSPNNGFNIKSANRSGDNESIEFTIEPGVFYLGGLRVERKKPEQFRKQKDWLLNPGVKPPQRGRERHDLVYLEAWEQPVSAVEDQELYEKALGGPDTSYRLRRDGVTKFAVSDRRNGTFKLETEAGQYAVSVVSPGYRIEELSARQPFIFARQISTSLRISVTEEERELDDSLAFLSDIRIERNDIAHMGLSGIGIPQIGRAETRYSTAINPVVKYFGQPIETLGIHRNHIHDCLRTPFDDELRSQARIRGHGGIALGVCEDITIEGNRIERNGRHSRNDRTFLDAVCGIYIRNGTQVDIHHNLIQVPPVTKNDALVHGRVIDENGRGIRGLVVRLVNREDVPVQEADESTTDGSGYFAIVLRSKSFDKLNQRDKAEVFLGIFDGKCHLLYQHCKPLSLFPGARLEEEIRLDRDELLAGMSVGQPSPKPKSQMVQVPDLKGLKEEEAVRILQERNLKVGKRETRVAPDQVNLIVDQEPPANQEVPVESPVSLVIGIAENVRETVVARLESDPEFKQIGISVNKLHQRLEAMEIQSREQFEELLTRDNRDLRDNLGLPNLKSAEIFKQLLEKALRE